MKLFDSIDGLLAGTRYLAWGIALLGIVGSVVLFFANLSLGLGSAAVFLATFFLAIGVTLLLLPKPLSKGKLEGIKKYGIGAVAVVIALIVMGAVWFTNGGFPAVNLIFA